MFKGLLCRLAPFRPHVHTPSCVVCSGAVAASERTASRNERMRQSNTPVVIDEQINADSIFPFPFDHAVPRTVEEMREEAYRTWLVRLLEPNEKKKCFEPEKSAESALLFETYLHSPEAATNEVIEGAARHLDSFCRRPDARPGEPAHSASVRADSMLSFPSHFTIPLSVVDLPVKGEPAKLDRNDFLALVKDKGLTPKEVTHQQMFQSALLAFQQVLLRDTGLPFFLCCGTALGARRERYFIPHDDDIDVGIFYKSTVLHEATPDAVAEEAARFLQDPYSAHCTSRASKCVSKLLADLTFGGQFVVFDVCGTVDKGLEVRLLHAQTGVRLDVNWYYPPLPELHDEALVKQKGAFLWSATYYEEAGRRRHGMYRYLHTSLQEEKEPLEALFFCSRHKEDESLYFMTPKEDYLLECFGEDWRTPKAYSYAEGLQGEFTNIIKE
ncbi:hypothetical protein STCU_08260 [Strigomonas culicis]|uniref:LicD/FKTN/FKRP nucleotidyltransferase domain-containing protein n=1 Tax=Strigomonas culicis TaxID=28005 RepID=S9TV23_9TRYP|nr:hypothetical protein STCU_08260 [Strigomonas culicis]|eukprot:EPY22287.1 hypothetical protein STCU_08260 [Strigomonas culicis]